MKVDANAKFIYVPLFPMGSRNNPRSMLGSDSTSVFHMFTHKSSWHLVRQVHEGLAGVKAVPCIFHERNFSKVK